MLQDPNVERVIKNYTEPLQKQISMMQIELEALKKQCNISSVVKSFTTDEIVRALEDCDHLDDAIMYFNERK